MLAIITVLYRSEGAVEALWASLSSQTFRDWRLYVIDNAYPDAAADYLESTGDRRVRVTRNRTNTGFAGGANAGLSAAVADGAQRCLLLNPDVHFEPDFFARLQAAWTCQEVIAPRVMLQGSKGQAWYAGGQFDRKWVFTNQHWADPAMPDCTVEFASGCCLGLTSAVLRRVGLLDESMFVYWEDADYCMRLKEAQIAISYLRDPCLWHEGGASSGGERAPAAKSLYYKAWAVFLRKHFGLQQAARGLLRLVSKEAGRGRLLDAMQIAGPMLLGLMVRPRPLANIEAPGLTRARRAEPASALPV